MRCLLSTDIPFFSFFYPQFGIWVFFWEFFFLVYDFILLPLTRIKFKENYKEGFSEQACVNIIQSLSRVSCCRVINTCTSEYKDTEYVSINCNITDSKDIGTYIYPSWNTQGMIHVKAIFLCVTSWNTSSSAFPSILYYTYIYMYSHILYPLIWLF